MMVHVGKICKPLEMQRDFALHKAGRGRLTSSSVEHKTGAIFQQDNARPHTARVLQDGLHTVTTLLWPPRSPDLSPIEHIWDQLVRRVENPTSLNELEARFVSNRAYLGSVGTASWESDEFERTRGKVTSNMERNVSRHHTDLVGLNARSYRLVHSR
ncbi:uncharacterized protein TNCV_46771 [Trichonephila clavipes]|nr:uncharacterized protein TNCV_46771 [Trichonephila clavipes]